MSISERSKPGSRAADRDERATTSVSVPFRSAAGCERVRKAAAFSATRARNVRAAACGEPTKRIETELILRPSFVGFDEGGGSVANIAASGRAIGQSERERAEAIKYETNRILGEATVPGRAFADPSPNPFIIVSNRSSRLMLIVLVSCALTIALTRLFLVLTGYPQIGGSTFHLAHALWGGLALFLASTMALVVQNRGAAVIIALLTGIGFGLFVDEVGKFITQKNDYFFPLAAPIVYASLLLILLFTELARRHLAAQSESPPVGCDL